jgi:nicotinamide mononucleotide transporter
MSPLEIFAALVGAVSVYLSVRENVWSWPTAIVNVLLYVVVFFRERLYADMGLQVVYAIISAYGWYHWLHGGAARGALRVSRTPLRQWLVLPALVVAGAAGLSTILARFTPAALPALDSSLTATSLAAQWMMTRKYVENWIVWIVVDVVYVPMFIYKRLYATAALYAVFLVLAAMGWVQWRRSLRAVVEERGGSPVVPATE